MTRISMVLRYVAFAMMALFGVFGGLFVIGETFADPGGWTAAWMSALWVVPLVALCVFALTRPAAAGPLFVAVTVLVSLFTVADSTFGIIPRDDWGPVAAVTVFALGVALGFLGLNRAGLAGVLMLLTGLAQVVAIVIGVAVRAAGDTPGPGAMLGGSSGVVIMPIVLVGALFLVSGLLSGEPSHAPKPPRIRPAH